MMFSDRLLISGSKVRALVRPPSKSLKPNLKLAQPSSYDKQRVALRTQCGPVGKQKSTARNRGTLWSADSAAPLGDIESQENFAMLLHGPSAMHEARLGSPQQPSFLTARKGGPPAQPAKMTYRCDLDHTTRK
jgi:hypothetical protein